MKVLSACAVGVAAFALQASAAPLRFDLFVAAPVARPAAVDNGMHQSSRPVPIMPVRVPEVYAYKPNPDERHPTIYRVGEKDGQLHPWVNSPPSDPTPGDGAGGDGAGVMVHHHPGPPQEDEIFRHWVLTHPEIQQDHAALRYRPAAERVGKKSGCHRSGAWSNPFNRLVNSMREALGLRRPAPFQPPRASASTFADGVIYSMTAPGDAGRDDRIVRQPDARWPMPFHHKGQGRHHRFHHHRAGDWHQRPFGRRVMHALYILGPVEGRIVAFVLGLGIGALVRVVFVLALLSYRAVTGRTRRIMLEEDEEEMSAPIVIERVFEIREKEQAPAYTAVVCEGEQTLAPPS